MKKILSIAIFIMAIVLMSACGTTKSKNADKFLITLSDKDTCISEKPILGDRYYAETNDDCKIIKGKKMDTPAYLGSRFDSLYLTESHKVVVTLGENGISVEGGTISPVTDGTPIVIPPVAGGSSSGVPDWIKILFWVIVALVLVALAIWGIRHLLADTPSNDFRSEEEMEKRYSSLPGLDMNATLRKQHRELNTILEDKGKTIDTPENQKSETSDNLISKILQQMIEAKAIGKGNVGGASFDITGYDKDIQSIQISKD